MSVVIFFAGSSGGGRPRDHIEFYVASGVAMILGVALSIPAFGRRTRVERIVAQVKEPGKARPLLRPQCLYVLTTDDERVVCRAPGGAEQSVGWDELEVVAIETNDTGPLGMDVWWVLEGRSEVCRFPLGAAGGEAVQEKLNRLPDFDSQAVIDAMACTGNRRFVCWKKK